MERRTVTPQFAESAVAHDPLLNVEAACAYLGGISTATLYTWFSRGTLARVKVGSRVMVRRSSLDAMLREEA
jgi:excisionase family DNA binding protein